MGALVKRLIALLVSIVVCLGALSATGMAESFYSYMNYYNHLDNESSVDWLEDAHQKAPQEVQQFFGNQEKTFKGNPLLDEYPAQTAIVYRTANFYGGQAAVSNNTSILVFAEEDFQSAEDGRAYLQSLGLIDLIDSLIGSIVLITPADPASGFTQADLENYYNLHDAIYTQNTSETLEDGSLVYHADAAYFGAYGKIYFVGIDGGATFINNYIAPGRFDCIGRSAGLLLIGGEMEEDVEVSNYVPTYLLNGTQTAKDAYCRVNETDSYTVEDGRETFCNTQAPLRKVMAREDAQTDTAAYIREAFEDLLLKAQRLSVISSYTQEAGYDVPYLSYVDAPAISRYALCERNAILDGVTQDGGLQVTFHQEDIFSEYKTMYDQYLQSWYEILPASVVDNTAPAGSVPLILALHGTGDDPLMYADEIGLLEVAGREGLAVVAPFEEELVVVHEGARAVLGVPIYEGVNKQALPALIDYLLETYPALDPTRVYATGYSLGGGSTYRAAYGGLEKIAAIVPMAGMHDDMIYHSTPEEDALLDEADMPCMILTSTYDLGFDQQAGRLTDNTLLTVEIFCEANDIELPEYDFEQYPMLGLPSDDMSVSVVGGEWRTFLWHMENEQGIPIMAVSCTENLTHSLYPGYGEIAWDFMEHFSRDPESGEVVYTENCN